MPRATERPALSLLADAMDRQEVLCVLPNEASSIVFDEDVLNTDSIGTRDVNGGFAVAIVSEWAAVLTHIPPCAPGSWELEAGLNNLRMRMDNFVFQYEQIDGMLLPLNSKVYVMVPTLKGQVTLPEHLDDILNILEHNSLPRPLMVEYEVRQKNFDPAYGTMFVDAREGAPVVYVEDQQVSETELSEIDLFP